MHQQHVFNISVSPRKKILQILTHRLRSHISEVVNLHIDELYTAGDLFILFRKIDDLWIGMWEIFRVMNRSIKCRCEALCRSVKHKRFSYEISPVSSSM